MDSNLSEEEKKQLEKVELMRVKVLRLVKRLGLSTDESIAARVMYRLQTLIAGRHTCTQLFSLDAAKRTALRLEAEGKDDLDLNVNILVLGKSGVGKSATINSIFGEEKALINAFGTGTTSVTEISGMLYGVKIRVFDTPSLKSCVTEQVYNRRVLSSVLKFTKKNPPDIVLYVDRLDTLTRDLNDVPLLKTITTSLGQSIWRNAIVTLTHAASTPPDGLFFGSRRLMSYDVFVTQRSHVVQQSIGQAVGDVRMMSSSLMNPVSLVENHPSCRKNRSGQKVLPNGQTWRPQLLLLCYSMKILSEAAGSFLKPQQDPFDHRKLFGFRLHLPPPLDMLSSMLEHLGRPKLSAGPGDMNGDTDIDLADLSDSNQEDDDDDEDEYDQLPPFKKKQWREEWKTMREIRKKGKDAANDHGYTAEDGAMSVPAAVQWELPPSFDGDNHLYRYRFLGPTPLSRVYPISFPNGWDHDCGYVGLILEQSLAIASQFPAAVGFQFTEYKKELSIRLAAKHGENSSSLAGFDIQNIGKELSCVIRSDTKFRILKNKIDTGISFTKCGENVATGFKIQDQIALGKRYVLVGNVGTVQSQVVPAYGANFELQRRGLLGSDVHSKLGLSLIQWGEDLAINSLAQIPIRHGRTNMNIAVEAGVNQLLNGKLKLNVKTGSNSEHPCLALVGTIIIRLAIAIYRKFSSRGPDRNYSIY